jgi:hypothetical protein
MRGYANSLLYSTLGPRGSACYIGDDVAAIEGRSTSYDYSEPSPSRSADQRAQTTGIATSRNAVRAIF